MQRTMRPGVWGIVLALVVGPALLGGAGCGQDAVDVAGGAGSTSSAAAGEGGAPGGEGGGGTGGSGGAMAGSGGAMAGSGGGQPAVEGLSILAWNMESFPLTAETPGLVVGLITEMQPDIVGVEEIEDDPAFLTMVSSIPGYAAVIAYDPGSFTRVGMLYRQDRVTVSEVETLFESDWYAFPRPPLKVRVTFEEGGFDFDFLVIHLKAQVDAESEARRKAACAALNTWMQERIAGGGDPDIVLAGDWNDKITDAPAYNVFQVFLDAPEQYRFLTQEVADAGDYSYIPFSSLIDHVLVTTPVLNAYGDGATDALHLEDSVMGYSASISDHRPIRVRFAAP